MPAQSTSPEVIYKDAFGWVGYRVGTDGSVWSGSRRLKCTILNNGYVQAKLTREGKHFGVSVHKLILETFRGPCPPGNESAHDNGVRNDNRLENLFWKTKIENAADRDRHGRQVKGEKQWKARLTPKIVREIRRRGRGYETPFSIAERFSISVSTVKHVLAGRTWKHVA